MSLFPTLSANPFVEKALSAERQFRENTIQEINALKDYINSHRDNCTFDSLKDALFKRVKMDQDYFDWFQKNIDSYPLGHNPAKNEAPYSIKTLHMRDVVKRARDLLEDNLGLLFYAIEPSGFRVDRSETTVLGEQSSIWGNSKGTVLKTAFIEIALTMRDLAIKESGKDQTFSNISDLECLNLDTSHLAHQVPIPSGLYHHDSSFTTQSQSGYALTFTHSGYAYGGHRGEAKYPKGKVGGPEDCSSFISKLMGTGAYVTTLNQQQLYQSVFEPSFQSAVTWSQSPAGKDLSKRLTPLHIRDPQRDVKPGQIYTIRTFPKPSGHTGLVLNFESNGKNSQVNIINYNRTEPTIEGFGYNLAPFETTAARKVMLFDVNQQ